MDATNLPDLKPLRDYRDKLPGHNRGSRTHLSTLIRFCTHGKRTSSGELVRLRAIRFGARWFITDAWWGEFIGAFLNAPVAPIPEVATPARLVPVGSASAELDAIGIR